MSWRRSRDIIVPNVFLFLDRCSAKWPFRGARQRLEGVASPAFLRQLRLAMIPRLVIPALDRLDSDSGRLCIVERLKSADISRS